MRPRILSIRVRVGLALGLMAALVLIMATLSVTGIYRASYLLARADKSHRQLELMSRLSSEVNAHLVQQINALVQGHRTEGLDASRHRIDRLFEDMQRLVRIEIALIQGDSERAAESAELQWLVRLHGEVEALFEQTLAVEAYAPDTGRALGVRVLTSRLLGTVHDRLQPLIDDAITDERAEIDTVERAMARIRNQLVGFGLLLVIGCLVLAMWAAWHINRSLARPISALIQAASALSSGDLRRRLPEFQRDELGLLALHFNRMAHRLEHQRTRLETLNAELEQRVAERTESLTHSNARLQAIDDSRKRFLANVSHELRTPLTAILGETELSLREVPDTDSDTMQSLLRINANAGYLRRRVQDLLLLARSEEGVLRIEPRPVDLTQLVPEVCGQVRGLADVEQVEIRVCVEGRPAFVEVDPSWIGQCLMGLIDNAVKFSVPGDRVEVALGDAGQSWRIDILDQGPGFEDDTVPDLFDRYYQTQGGRLRGGAGLGLAIAHWIVTRHGGEIGAANTRRGACVTLKLPKRGGST